LHTRGIGTAIHYPSGIHQQPFYRKATTRYRIPPQGLLITETAARQVLSLPVHPALSQEDLATIVKEVLTLCV